MEEQMRKAVVNLATFCAGTLSVAGFYDVSRQYDQYRILYAGTFTVLSQELSFYAWYLAFGILATLSFTAVLRESLAGEPLDRSFEKLFSWKFFLPAALIVLAEKHSPFNAGCCSMPRSPTTRRPMPS